MIGYEYGNTRLRVRASQLLDAEGYRSLLGAGSLDGVVGALAHGPYARDVELALGRHSGLRRIDEAVRTHLATQLSDVLSFYAGDIRDRLRLYESRWDLRNVRTLLRSLAQRSRGESPTALLVAAGNLDEAALSELSSQPDVRSAVDLLSNWRLPSAAAIRHLRHDLPNYSQTGNVGLLEQALDRAFGERISEAAALSGREDPVIDLLQQEVDRINLTSALRRRQANLEDQLPEPFEPIGGGRISDAVWADITELPNRADIATRLNSLLPTHWRPAVTAWEASGDTTALEDSLDAATARAAVVRFRRGDPLGIDVPLGFIGRKEAEAKNLRLVGRAVANDLPRDDVLDRLLGVT